MSVILSVYQGSGSGNYANYARVPIVAWTPAEGNHFSYWSYAGNCTIESTSSPSTYANLGLGPVGANAYAHYAWNYYDLWFLAGTGGTTSNGYQSVRHGLDGVQVVATPNSGYHFVNWSDGVTSASRTPTNVTSAINVTANFEADAPTITSLSVAEGPPAGGTTTVITGTYFTSASAVKFGATDAASYTVDSATQITAVSPAGSLGTVDIVVTTPSGTDTLEDGFEYVTPVGSYSGAVTPTGAVTNRATGHVTSGVLTFLGTVLYVHSSSYAIYAYATVAPTGQLFAHTLRPKTLYAPFVQTTLVAP